MTDIAIAITPDTELIAQAIRALFPRHNVFVGRDWSVVPTAHDLAVVLYPNESEFPCGLSISAHIVPGHDLELWLRGLARALSIHFQARSLCDGTPFGDHPSPYWSLIWDNGSPLLGDDLESTLGDGAGGPVKIVRALATESIAVPTPRDLQQWLAREPS